MSFISGSNLIIKSHKRDSSEKSFQEEFSMISYPDTRTPCPSPCALWSLLLASLPGFPEFAWALCLHGLPGGQVPARLRDGLSCSLQCVERDVDTWSRGRDHTALSHCFYGKIHVEKVTLGGGDGIWSEVFSHLKMFGSCYHAQHPINNNSPRFQLRE